MPGIRIDTYSRKNFVITEIIRMRVPLLFREGDKRTVKENDISGKTQKWRTGPDLAGVLRVSGSGHEGIHDDPEPAFNGADADVVQLPAGTENIKRKKAADY